MASPESIRIRAELSRASDRGQPPPVAVMRQEWETAVEAVNRGLRATVTAVDVNGILGEWIHTGQTAGEGAILFFHGGGFNAGSCRTHRALAARIAAAADLPVLLIDYRLAPEYPCPAAVEDGVRAYCWLLRQGLSPNRMVFGGDSAGAALVMATLATLRDAGTALPAAAVLLSPWVDLALAGPSLATHAAVDPLTSRDALNRAAELYLAGRDPRDPVASPLYAPLHDLPPLLIQTGGLEILQSDATRLAERAEAARVPVTVEVWEGMWHVWHAWAAELPEAREALARTGAFVAQHVSSSTHGQTVAP